MTSDGLLTAARTRTGDATGRRDRTVGDQAISDRSLVLRNHDGAREHEVHVQFVSVDGAVAFDRTFALAPLETVTVRTRLERAVYRVTARLDSGARASAECLVGSGVNETALVETGNGTASVVEGIL